MQQIIRSDLNEEWLNEETVEHLVSYVMIIPQQWSFDIIIQKLRKPTPVVLHKDKRSKRKIPPCAI